MLSNSKRDARIFSGEAPASSMAASSSCAMPVQASPAPMKSTRCSAIGCFVMRSPARTPATATAAVPWMSSLKDGMRRR